MKRAAAFLLALLTTVPATATVQLVPANELNVEVDELKDALRRNADPVDLHHRAGAVFHDAEATRHIPYAGQFGGPTPDKFNLFGGPVTESQVMKQYETLMIRPVPEPSPKADRDDRENLEWQSFFAAQKVYANGRMHKDTEGKLQKGVIGAYLWEVADGALGVVLFQKALFETAEAVGEVIMATVAHEATHVAQHIRGELSAEEVVSREIPAFDREGDMLHRIGDDKIARAQSVCMIARMCGEAGVQYMTHIKEVKRAWETNDLEDFVRNKRGYKDRPAMFHQFAPVEKSGDGAKS